MENNGMAVDDGGDVHMDGIIVGGTGGIEAGVKREGSVVTVVKLNEEEDEEKTIRYYSGI